jgi:hypothetical protein
MFALMKRGTYVVNTAHAVVRALESVRLAGDGGFPAGTAGSSLTDDAL